MEEFCKLCTVSCCYIYRNCKSKEHVREIIFNGDLNQYGVAPLKQEGDKCEFLGENGCIIEKSKRPKICLDYECPILRAYKAGDKDAAKIFNKISYNY